MPNRFLIEVCVALVLLALSFGGGWLIKGWKDDAAQLKTTQAEARAYAARIERFDTQAQNTLTQLIDAGQKTEVIRERVTREVTKYADRPCFDPDLVRVLNDAAAGSNPDRAAGEVPASTAGAP